MEYGLRANVPMGSTPETVKVLILVLMEYGLRGLDDPRSFTRTRVLILVLMEYGLRVGCGWLQKQRVTS